MTRGRGRCVTGASPSLPVGWRPRRAAAPRRAGRWSAVGSAVLAVALNLTGVGPAAVASAAMPLAHERVLYDFNGPNGAGPLSGVTPGVGGVLYGTTVFGGPHGAGDVYRLTPAGSGYHEAILHTFGAGHDGSKPGGDVAVTASGDLIGVTTVGGADGQGTVFELVPSGSGDVEHVLHTFTGGADGGQPIGTPVVDGNRDVFGVTQFGGPSDGGVAYELEPAAGGYHERVLHDFPFAAALPQAGLVLAADGSLYGTGYGAGNVHPDGLVFRLRPDKGGYAYSDLYNFKGGTDGANPYATLTIVEGTGAIFGTTEYGGGAGGEGTVFALTPRGGGYAERVLHAFTPSQGALLESPVLWEPDGDLFGTATGGGSGCGAGCGTVFELVPSGSGYDFKLVHAFAGPPDGAEPEWAPLVPLADGDLLGTTRSGGTATGCDDGGPGGVTGCGTLYELTR